MSEEPLVTNQQFDAINSAIERNLKAKQAAQGGTSQSDDVAKEQQRIADQEKAANIEKERLAAEQEAARIEAERLSSLNNETPEQIEVKRLEAEKLAAANQSPAQKSFEEVLLEKSGGKFKDWSEIEPILTKEEVKFATDGLKRLNDMVLNGEITEKEFHALQAEDFISITQPEAVLIKEMKLDKKYKGWSDKELQLFIDKKYQKKEWAGEGEDPTDDEILNKRLLTQDAEEARQRLIQKQESVSIAKPKPTAAEIESNKKTLDKQWAEWEESIDRDVLSKGSKLTTVIDPKTKEVFEYELPESTKKELGVLMKGIGKDVSLFWNEFKGADGKIDNKLVYDFLAWKKEGGNMLGTVAQTYMAKGAKGEFDRLKNINFKPDGSGTSDINTKKKPAEIRAENVRQSILGK